jgi:hypothetical protein
MSPVKRSLNKAFSISGIGSSNRQGESPAKNCSFLMWKLELMHIVADFHCWMGGSWIPTQYRKRLNPAGLLRDENIRGENALGQIVLDIVSRSDIDKNNSLKSQQSFLKRHIFAVKPSSAK